MWPEFTRFVTPSYIDNIDNITVVEPQVGLLR